MRKIILMLTSWMVILTGCTQNQQGQLQLTWWGWLLIIIGILLLALLLYFLTRKKSTISVIPHRMAEPFSSPAGRLSMETSPLEVPTALEPEKPTSRIPRLHDDLTLIEGIGPKINTVLQGAGITTFSDLAELDPQKIKDIISGAGIRLADVSTWAEQARLAASDEMDELKTYQNNLKGGRAA